jgi:Tol biopolymer transport system component
MRVRFPAYQFNFHGTKQLILPAGGRTPVNHFNEHPDSGLIYFVHNDASLPRSGPRVKTFNTKTGEVEIYIDRPGGAGSIRLSPDGKHLAYVHRDDTKTVLVLHELATKRETVLSENLDYGRFESRGFYGAYPNISWYPNGTEIVLSYGGKIHAVNVTSKEDRVIGFSAPVEREIKETNRNKVDVPEGTVKTRSHRWGQKLGEGVLYETLGDIYLKEGENTRNLTQSPAHETNPVFHVGTRAIFYASWTDQGRGGIFRLDEGGTKKELVSSPTQYGSIAVSTDGNSVAFIRGGGSMMKGTQLENQRDFELMLLDKDGKLTRLAPVNWSGNRYAKRPPSVRFSIDGRYVYYSDYENDKLTIKRVNLEGLDKQSLFTFTNATRAAISPDFNWIVFREYHRTFVTPFEYLGKHLTISAADNCLDTGKIFLRKTAHRDSGEDRKRQANRPDDWIHDLPPGFHNCAEKCTRNYNERE